MLRRILEGQADGSTAITRGSTAENAAHLPDGFLKAMESEYAGGLLARQELAGELIEDIQGALWNRALIERARDAG